MMWTSPEPRRADGHLIKGKPYNGEGKKQEVLILTSPVKWATIKVGENIRFPVLPNNEMGTGLWLVGLEIAASVGKTVW